MMATRLQIARSFPTPLKCHGVGCDEDNMRALSFYFNRPLTYSEMRFLHDVVELTVGCIPESVSSIKHICVGDDTMDFADNRASRIVAELNVLLRGNAGYEELKPATALWLTNRIAEAIRDPKPKVPVRG